MKERPILFQGAMVRALLDGSKTQTRRKVKPQPRLVGSGHVGSGGYFDCPKHGIGVTEAQCVPLVWGERDICPYGQPGDRLWVRESHWYFKDEYDHETGYFPPPLRLDDFEYRADGESDRHGWYPSIHMPRIGSRITLEITGVRVERLQDIREADAKAEGAEPLLVPPDGGSWPYVEGYRELWESINGAGSWDVNPWVWVVEFKVVKP